MYTPVELLGIAGAGFQILVLVRIVLSWAPVPIESEFTRFVRFYTDPILAPLSAEVTVGPGFRLDLAPLFALALIHELTRLAVHLARLP